MMKKSFVLTNAQMRFFNKNCQLCSKGSNVVRQSKIMGKLFGERVSGSKTHWYPTEDSKNNITVGGTTHFGRDTSVAGPKKHKNIRRMSVLNKLFMTHITDLLATGENSEMLIGRGLHISHVKISSHFDCVNVYWMGSGEPHADAALETDLQRCSGQLRHELSQLRLMGEVPCIKFVRDKTGEKLNHLEVMLRNIKVHCRNDEVIEDSNVKSDLQVGYDAAQQVREELYGSENIPEKEPTTLNLDSSKELFVSLPTMRHDVFGLNHRDVLSKILTKMRKTQEAWEQRRNKIGRDGKRPENNSAESQNQSS